MTMLYRGLAGAMVVAGVFAACRNGRDAIGPRESAGATYDPSDPMSTMGTGTASTPLGRATFSDPHDQTFKVMRKTGDWDVDIKSKPAVDVAIQSIVFQPGGQSGWHSHPGPVFIVVKEGTMTFYQADDPTCTPVVRNAGEGFLDLGEHAHIARNEGTLPATNTVVYFAPPGAGLKIDQPAPGTPGCPL
jgi:Cupin domain